jgi:hypothetical protein
MKKQAGPKARLLFCQTLPETAREHSNYGAMVLPYEWLNKLA